MLNSSHIRRLLKNPHSLSLIVQGSGAVFGFVTFVLLIRWLSAEEAGVWILFVTGSTLADMLRSGFVQPGLIRELRGTTRENIETAAGSGLVVSLVWTAIFSSAGLIVWALDLSVLSSEGFVLFLSWWPLVYAVSAPGQYMMWVQQAASRFDRILAFRTGVSALFLAGVIVLHSKDALTLQAIPLLLVVSTAIPTILSSAAGWIGWKHYRRASRAGVLSLIRFGRYSVTTLLGTNLLKSSDTFLIGIFLGPAAVAVYGIAQKVIEALEIPLRALSASLYPVMARSGMARKYTSITRQIEMAASVYFVLSLGPTIGLYLFAPQIVTLIGGVEYLAAVPIIRIFSIYALVLPLDRLIGLGLDSIGRPEANTMKVVVMLVLNVVGDVIALLWLGSVVAVSVVTIVMTVSGILIGLWLLRPDVHLSVTRSFERIRRFKRGVAIG
jgi:O-antigen/teichoic acid export membrane protein